MAKIPNIPQSRGSTSHAFASNVFEVLFPITSLPKSETSKETMKMAALNQNVSICKYIYSDN